MPSGPTCIPDRFGSPLSPGVVSDVVPGARFMALVAPLLAALIALVAQPRAAHSQTDPAGVATITQINRKALDDYDNLNFDEARNELKEALALCDRNGMGSHPLRAQTYLNLGVVLLAADAAHRDVAVAHFRRALQIQPDIRLPERIANPEVQLAFAQAKASVGGAGGPVAAVRAPDKKAAASNAGSDTDADADIESEAPAGGLAPHDSWFFAFGVGSGVGLARGNGEVNTAVKLPSGFQPSSVVHLAPEIGYFVRPNLLLSVQGRFQLISGATAERNLNQTTTCGADHVCAASKGATAVFAKASWLFGQGALRPYLGGALGVGQIRHVATLPNHADCGADAAHPVSCVDTALAGPIFIGPSAGLVLDLARHFSLTLGASTLLGFSAFTFHVDVNAGVAVAL
jgi:tetratricopeptide (TPR) repeat protein